jgi:hypothetical protein
LLRKVFPSAANDKSSAFSGKKAGSFRAYSARSTGDNRNFTI